MRDRVEVVEGSHGNAGVVDRALDGAEALIWLAPPNTSDTLDGTYRDFTRLATEAIRRHGIAPLPTWLR